MKRNEKNSIIAGLYGNALEWYDFLLYASFAPIFAEIFFPTRIPFLSLMGTFSVFAIGFFMRPIGGAIFGHYADYVGRRKALILSISIMTLATLAIALLPTVHSAGIVAPILFTLLRLIQGVAVGGELPSSTTFLIEHMVHHRRGLAGSLVLSTAFLGILAGLLIASLLSAVFSYQLLIAGGWRLAYLLGGILGLVGIYLRIRSVESPKFKETTVSKELPIKLVFTKYGKQLLFAIIFTSIMALPNYILVAYFTTFLVKTLKFTLEEALIINLVALFVLTILIPVMGFLSDFVGRKPIFILGISSVLVLIFPIFWLLNHGTWVAALSSEVLLAVILAPLNATIPTIIAEIFPTAVRASGSSIGYNISQALFGGTAPLVAIALIELTGNNFAPAWYVFACGIIVFITALFLQETYNKKLL